MRCLEDNPLDRVFLHEYFKGMVEQGKGRLSNITPGELDAMVGDGRVSMEPVMPGHWVLKMRKHTIGKIDADPLLGGTTVTVGKKVICQFPD